MNQTLDDFIASQLAADLEKPGYAAAWLQESLDESERTGDADGFHSAIAHLARAQGLIGAEDQANEAAVPDITTVARALRTLGMEIRIVESERAKRSQ